jgi:hypothetical protein
MNEVRDLADVIIALVNNTITHAKGEEYEP